MGFRSSILAGTSLIRQAIKSPNFVTGAAGWSVNKDGSAEFNNITIRGGSVQGGDMLLYSGTPAAGTLFMSISQNGGTDPYGNIYPAGQTIYDTPGTDVLAQVLAEFSQYGGGFWTRGFQFPKNVFSQLQGGLLRFNAVDIPGQASQDGQVQWVQDDGTTGYTSMTVKSGAYHPADRPAWLELNPSSPLFARPTFRFKDNGGGLVEVIVKGDVAVTEYVRQDGATWQTPNTYQTTWAGTGTFPPSGATFPALQYRIDAEDNVWLYGCVAAGAAPGTTIFTLPAGYAPALAAQVPANFFDSSAATRDGIFIAVMTSGTVVVSSGFTGATIAASDVLFINGKFPRGNIA